MDEAASLLSHTVTALQGRKDQVKQYLDSGQPQLAGFDDYALAQVENKLARSQGLYGLVNGKLDEETASRAMQATQEKIIGLESALQFSDAHPAGDTTDDYTSERLRHRLSILKAQREIFSRATGISS